jgi:predicted secreted hydrolase
MKSRFAALAALLLLHPLAAQYRTAVPGYRFEFPRDYFNHPDFQTEWWYYTGNLTASNGRHFGFELTFFRQAVSRDPAQATDWTVRDLYLAHLALSDLDGQQFYHFERVNRAGPGIAGVDASTARIWNGNWQVQWKDSDEKEVRDQQLEAIENNFQLHLQLHSQKPPVIHGENGVSQKSAGAGHASYYISLTHLATTGEILLNGETFSVSGLAWMDHEFFTEQLQPDQVGWDWLSLQLNDNTELMLFHLRRTDGSVDPYSSGTFIDAQGHSLHLRNEDFTLQPVGETWNSPITHAAYPISWAISIPKLGLALQAQTKLPNQELASNSRLSPTYWEGAISLSGQRASQPLNGVGYLEMTGYAQPVKLAP